MGWTDELRRMPRRCVLSGLSDSVHGPFYDTGRLMGEVDGNGKLTGRIHFIQVSLEGIRGLLNEANMEIVDKGTLARYADRVADLDARLAEANDALRELAKEKATLESMLNDEDRRLERMADTVFSRVKMRRGR